MDIIRPNYRSLPMRGKGIKVSPSQRTETHKDDKSDVPYVVNRDRRKNQDRRSAGGNSRKVYDMRSSRGRRKEDGASCLEVKV